MCVCCDLSFSALCFGSRACWFACVAFSSLSVCCLSTAVLFFLIRPLEGTRVGYSHTPQVLTDVSSWHSLSDVCSGVDASERCDRWDTSGNDRRVHLYLMFSLTILHIKGVGGQSQCGVAVVALEAAAMEELPLRAQPLHHVHALPTEEAHVAAADVDGELFSEGALWKERALISVSKE